MQRLNVPMKLSKANLMRGLKSGEKSPVKVAFDTVSMSSHYSKTSKTTGTNGEF